MSIICAQCGELICDGEIGLVISADVVVHLNCKLRYWAAKKGLTHLCDECWGEGGEESELDKASIWIECKKCRGSGLSDIEPMLIRLAKAAKNCIDEDIRKDCQNKIEFYEIKRRKVLGLQFVE